MCIYINIFTYIYIYTGGADIMMDVAGEDASFEFDVRENKKSDK